MSKELRQFLIEDCQNNKQIKSCSQCLYEKECNKTHINLIVKAIGQWLELKLDTTYSNFSEDYRERAVLKDLITETESNGGNAPLDK